MAPILLHFGLKMSPRFDKSFVEVEGVSKYPFMGLVMAQQGLSAIIVKKSFLCGVRK